jgi:hypothetical protein
VPGREIFGRFIIRPSRLALDYRYSSSDCNRKDKLGESPNNGRHIWPLGSLEHKEEWGAQSC